MTASCALRVSLGTGLTTVGLIIGHHGCLQINDAETGGTGTFHLTNGCHDDVPLREWRDCLSY